MATEFDDAQHFVTFKGPGPMKTGNAFDVRGSEFTLATMRAAGLLDRMVDGTTPPSTNMLWLDKNTDPAVLKEWDGIGSAWMPMTFERMFERAAVTTLAVSGGTANNLIVAQPASLFASRLYSLKPLLDNTGAVSLTITGVGSFPIRDGNGLPIVAGDMLAGKTSLLIFRSQWFELVLGYAAIGKATTAVQSVNGKTGNAVTLDKTDIGLGNVDNTSDANKPISTAAQTALNGKATTAQGAKADTAVQSVAGKTGTAIILAKADVGLSNVDNTSDANKPVSTATQTALNLKANSSSLGALAAKNAISVPGDISATGTPGAATVLFGDGSWKNISGGGDMLRSVYDPQNRQTDIFAGIDGKVSKAGDSIAGDLTIYRPSIPTQGYTFYGNNGQRWVGYDGTQYVMNGAGLTLGGNLTAGAAVFGTDGNLTGTVWQAWGSPYAQEAISNRISGFSSGQLTPTLGGLVQAAHGLGVKPRFYHAFLQCIVADAGWAVGDELSVYSDRDGSTSGFGVEIYADATNVYGRVGNTGLAVKFNKSTGAFQNLTVASWRIVLRARA